MRGDKGHPVIQEVSCDMIWRVENEDTVSNQWGTFY